MEQKQDSNGSEISISYFQKSSPYQTDLPPKRRLPKKESNIYPKDQVTRPTQQVSKPPSLTMERIKLNTPPPPISPLTITHNPPTSTPAGDKKDISLLVSRGRALIARKDGDVVVSADHAACAVAAAGHDCLAGSRVVTCSV